MNPSHEFPLWRARQCDGQLHEDVDEQPIALLMGAFGYFGL